MAPERNLDVVVVGGGGAGLYSALCAADAGARVAMVSRKPLPESSSFWAQGGLAAAIGPDDSPEIHVEDTLAAGRQACRASSPRSFSTVVNVSGSRASWAHMRLCAWRTVE